MSKFFITSFIISALLFPLIIAAEEQSAETLEAVNLDENIQSQDLGVAEPRLLPNSPFYFVKVIGRGIQYTFTFNSVAKVELRLQFANEKLMEAKILAEKKPAALPRALENYKVETDQLKKAVEKIPIGAVQDPKIDKFMNKFVDNILKQQKLFGKLEKESPSEVHESIEKAKDENAAKFSDIGLKLVLPEVLQEKITETTETQPGSDFKQFKNLEVLQQVAEKVPETAKLAIQQAIENSFNRLKGDLEKMSPQDQGKFKDYVQNIGGNETRHLAIIDDFERTELSQIVREEMEKTKQKILERVETRLKEYTTKQMATTQVEYLSHLSTQGQMEDLRVIKEMENNLSSQVMQPILDAKQAAVTKVIETLENAETPDQQKGLFEKIENKYYDVQQLEVFKEIDELIPPEKRELYEKLKERALTKMKEEVERAKTMKPEEKLMVLNTMAGNSPEHITILEELKAQSKEAVPIKPPQEMTQQTVERIERKVENIQDPVKFEVLKNKLEEKEVKKVVEQIKPEVPQKLEDKSETIARTMTPERAQWEINYAKSQIDEIGKAASILPPELRIELEKSSYRALMDAAKQHLQAAETAFANNNFGEAFGQATAALQNASNAQEARLKAIEQKGKLEERNEKWRKFAFEVNEKIPGLIPASSLTEKGLSLSVRMLLDCSIPTAPFPKDCEGKWTFKWDNRGCPYFECVGATKELPCANEGEKLNRDPKMGLTNQKCCTGLVEVRTSASYSFCKKPGAEGALECKVSLDCPQPLCPGLSSKCIEGKCIVPACEQPTVKTSEPKVICSQVVTFAINPENTKCGKFPTPCDVPTGWRSVDKCRECYSGEEKRYTCSDGLTTVDWCKCSSEEKMICISSPEKACVPSKTEVSLHPYTPSYNSQLVRGTKNYYFTSIKFSATSQSYTVSQVAVSRTGVSSDTDLTVVGLAVNKTQIGSTQTLDPTTHKVTFSGLSFEVPANSSKVLDVWADVSSAAAVGNTLALGITAASDITSTVTLEGRFPIWGNTMIIAAECKIGERKQYKCPDGINIVEWCSRGVEEKWNCTDSPEKSCPTTPLIKDTTPPVISDVVAKDITTDSAIITWKTDELTNSEIWWGGNETYGAGLSSPVYLTYHSMSLKGLLRPGMIWHYKVFSRDPSGNSAISPDYTFTTLEGPKCVDSDGGDNVYTYGEVTDIKGGVSKDVCSADSTSVTEYACQTDGLTMSKVYRCSSEGKVCSGGACIVSATTEKILKLTSPNGGETWTMGKTYDITWSSQNVEKVNMELAVFKDNARLGALGIDLNVLTSLGKYSWRILDSQHIKDGNNFKVVIRNAETPASGISDPATLPEDESDAYFSIVDTAPPVISIIVVRDITSSSAKIEWNTDEFATSQVIYGTTDTYHTGSETRTSFDSSLVASHSVPLSDLQPSVLYHYRVESKDAAGNLTVSGSAAFTTTATTTTP